MFCLPYFVVSQGNIPSRESLHVYYQKQMCRPSSSQSCLDRSEDIFSASGPQVAQLQQSGFGLESLASALSRDSLSRYQSIKRPTALTAMQTGKELHACDWVSGVSYDFSAWNVKKKILNNPQTKMLNVFRNNQNMSLEIVDLYILWCVIKAGCFKKQIDTAMSHD